MKESEVHTTEEKEVIEIELERPVEEEAVSVEREAVKEVQEVEFKGQVEEQAVSPDEGEKEEEREQIEPVSAESDERMEASNPSPAEETATESTIEEVEAASVELSKHEAAVAMVDEAKALVHEAEAASQECRMLLHSDLKDLQEVKATLNKGTVEKSETLLAQFGQDADKGIEEPEVAYEEREEIFPPRVHGVSSGAFGAFMVALFAGAVMLLGILYWPSQKLDIALSVEKMPDMQTVQTLISWYGVPISGSESLELGGGAVVLGLLLLMWMIYTIRKRMKAAANYEFASLQLEEVRLYSEEKGNCRQKMERIDAHIKAVIEVVKLYRVMLAEQNGKMERIGYLEGSESFDTLHPSSQEEVMETQKLVESLHHLLAMPLAEEGEVSPKATLMLQRAEDKADKVLKRYYGDL